MNNKMNHPLITVDGRTLMDRPLEPPNFVVDTLISQGLHILACPPLVSQPECADPERSGYPPQNWAVPADDPSGSCRLL